MKNGLIYGLIAGVLYMIWVIIGGNIFPNLIYGSIPVMIISSIVVIIFMALACQKEKTALDGSIQFGEAFLTCLMTYLVFNIVYGIGFKFYVDLSPTAMGTFLETTKQSTGDMLTMLGTPEDEVYKAMEDLDETLPLLFTWKNTLLGIFGGLVFPGGLLALIIAAITSKFPKTTV